MAMTQSTQFNQPKYGGASANANAYTNWSNRHRGYQGRLGGASQQLFGKIMEGFGQPGSGSGGFGSFSGVNYPNPGDSRVQGHMQELMGGQRQSVNDYVRQAQQHMGGGRGMRVQSGSNPQGQMARSATEQLSRGYGDRYGKAMGWAADAAKMDQAALGNYMNLLGTLYGQENEASRLALQGRTQQHQFDSDAYNRARQEEMDKRNMALQDRAREQREMDENRQRAAERQKQMQQQMLKTGWAQDTLGRGQQFPWAPQQKWDNYVSGPGQALAGRNPGWFL